jgi:DNA repair protein RecN (Recombination protein N)
MLTKLVIENVALVERAELTFDRGLSVLTGETGAGKSVVVTALSLALGERGDKDFIRHGAERCRVTAIFDASAMPAGFTAEFADLIENGTATVQREVSHDGGSKVRINGRPSSLAQLKALTVPLAEILGQHAGQMLTSEENHLGFLDRFAGLEPLSLEVSALFRDWQAAVDELRRTRNRRDQLAGERELLLFQKDDIEKAGIRPGEEEALLHRALMTSASLVQDILGGDQQSVAGLLTAARKELEKMAGIDDSLNQKMQELSAIHYELEDMRRFVERYGGSINDAPQRLEEVNLRLDQIYSLKKKYGGSEEGILKTLAAITEKLKDRPDIDGHIDKLEKDTLRLGRAYSDKALELSCRRHKAAARLRKLILEELAELAIDNGGFEFEFIYEDDPDGVIMDGRAVKPFEHGLENSRILFSANPGEPLRSLVKTASGGEMSRVFLALKSAERTGRRLPCSLLVFDEVDVGIGGATATAVARKLKRLSADNQVVVVTHLHQIASVADHHYAAVKTTSAKRSTITVKRLNKPQIAQELDRMVALPEEA